MKLLVYDVYLKDKNGEEATISICLEFNTVKRYFDNIQDTYYFTQLPNNELKKNINTTVKEIVKEELSQNPNNFTIEKLERNLIKENIIEVEKYKND